LFLLIVTAAKEIKPAQKLDLVKSAKAPIKTPAAVVQPKRALSGYMYFV
jgi:hypothetical protein